MRYYFGGDVNNSFSNFELIRGFIPFDINTILFTYLLLGLSITMIMYLIQTFLNKGFFTKFSVLLLSVVFHSILTAFFIKEPTAENMVKFSIIWLFPLFSSVLIFFFIRGIKNTLKVAAGSLFGLLIYIIFNILIQNSTNEYYSEVFLLLLIFIFGIGFTFLPFSKLWNVLFTFPFALLIVLLATPLMKFSYYQNFSIPLKVVFVLFLSLLLSWGGSIIFKKFFINKEPSDETNQATNSFKRVILEVTGELLNPKTHKKATGFLVIFLLIIYVLVPRLATETAKIIRAYTPDSDLQFHSIEFSTPNGSTKEIDGIVVAEKDNVLYISNEKWELEQIKTDQYYIVK